MTRSSAGVDGPTKPLAPATARRQIADVFAAVPTRGPGGCVDAADAFLEDAAPRVQEILASGSEHARFGMFFFLAGVCESVGGGLALDARARTDLLRRALTAFGVCRPRADAFADRFDTFLRDRPSYRAMVDAGYGAVLAFGRYQLPSDVTIAAALRAWEESSVGRNVVPARSLTMMFTDIVESCAAAQVNGDEFAVRLVRVHDDLVDRAISRFCGVRVRGTGDGLFATFDDATDALGAAVRVQRDVDRYNAAAAQSALRVRIGLNVGEAIPDRGDYFGSSVNLAARVCAAAGPGEVYCTSIVRTRAAHSEFRFVERGPYNMKGFPDPITLFRVTCPPDTEASAD